MNISIGRIVMLVLGAVLLIAGVYFGTDAMRAKDAVKLQTLRSLALVGIAVGVVLITGGRITVTP